MTAAGTGEGRPSALLADGLAELERIAPLGLPPAASARLLTYVDLLARWNRVYNLTAIREPEAMVVQHLLDALAILTSLDRVLHGIGRPRVADVGSGAGLPGLPLAIARPHWRLTLVDSNQKKTAFVRQAVGELRLPNAEVLTARAESCAGPYDLVVSRALATLADFVGVTRGMLGPGGTWAAMKGTLPEAEIRALPSDVEVIEAIGIRVPHLDAERHLLLMKVKSG